MEKEDSFWSQTTCSNMATAPLTSETLQDAIKLLEKRKRMVIFSTPYVTGQVICGKKIDQLLNCAENEEGFIVPESYRPCLMEYQDAYVERRPGRIGLPSKFNRDFFTFKDSR